MSGQIPDDIVQEVKEWLGYDYDPQTREAVGWLVENDPVGLRESFARRLAFGTGGMRGLMGVGPNRLNIYTVAAAAQAVASYMGAVYTDGRELRAVVAYDSRNNSQRFAETCAETLAANGVRTYLFDGVRPVPELSYAVRVLRCQVGVTITASHNPKEYNGFKLYWANGGQVVAPHDAGVVTVMGRITKFEHVKRGGEKKLIIPVGEELDEVYLNLLMGYDFTPELRSARASLKVVYTPIHGAGTRLAPLLLKRLGFAQVSVVSKQSLPDGEFPSVTSPNPEDAAALALAVEQAQSAGATLVLGTDPDADRVGAAVADGHGAFVHLDGEQIGLLMANYVLAMRRRAKSISKKDYMVRTVVTTPLIDALARSFGVATYAVPTGFKYIAALIDAMGPSKNFLMGIEESHGYLVGSELRDKDGIQACGIFAQLAAWAASRGCSPLDDLDAIYRQVGFSRRAQRSKVLTGIEGQRAIADRMAALRREPPVALAGERVVETLDLLALPTTRRPAKEGSLVLMNPSDTLQYITDSGSIVTVRPSGTEPKVKYYATVRMPYESYEKTSREAEARAHALIDALEG